MAKKIWLVVHKSYFYANFNCIITSNQNPNFLLSFLELPGLQNIVFTYYYYFLYLRKLNYEDIIINFKKKN